ncbi:glyoxalase/bleomycin resistance/dioxygenase family protein [Acrocarpospora sp. B8E8]|uniref:glyoxalase/bleomycin resistance/dioxygenase family protein n=1 Tax=Acrocarpospora sp. B8E8 TaxID=3153572 RepID=UPI00325CD7C6
MIHTNLIVIYTDRLDACHAFYTGLGLDFNREQHGRGPEHYAATLGPIVLELYPTGTGQPTGRLRLGLTIPTTFGPALPPGQHTLTDPDGRTVAVTITEEL